MDTTTGRRQRWTTGLGALLALSLAGVTGGEGGDRGQLGPDGAPRVVDLAGAWSATLEHAGETTPFGLELVPEADGKVTLKLTVPSMHLAGLAIGTVPFEWKDGQVRLGPFRLAWEPRTQVLRGKVPEGLAPVYGIPLVLHRVGRLEPGQRPEPGGPIREPRWTFEAGSPLWAGATFADGVVYAGGLDGRVHALDGATGRERWSFASGGEIRVRPTVDAGSVYFQADDGMLYAVAASTGQERWRARVVSRPVKRLPFDDPKSRFDRFGSDVTVAGGRLFLGTHEGRVLCVDPANGATVWEFGTGDAVLAAPAVASGRVFAASFDKGVYALEAGTGHLLWRHDAGAPVVSTPAVHEGRVIVGTRAYDLVALDAGTGKPAWSRYIWFSWVESSPTVRDGVVYVGSSDAAAVFAFDAATGRSLWTRDVFGWAWGQLSVTASRVYVCTSSQVGYPAGHRAGVMALDRTSGRVAWRATAPPPESGAFGYPGSTAVGGGLVYATGLDGRVIAFDE